MKKLLYIIVVISLSAISCSTSSVRKSARIEKKAEANLVVGKAIESDRYIINVGKMYTSRGFMVDMVPGANYIAVNKNRARINLGYLGRSFDTMPIAAINLNGYILEKNVTTNKKGGYTVYLKVTENNEVFNVNLVIKPGGTCDVGISHPRIDYARYRGQFRLQ
ncbi:MAG: DUF4251 domain-containing protein [Bacteroidales bacterium]